MTPLKRIRTKENLTIYEVAHGAGCAPATVSRVERGEGTSPELAEKIAQYFGGRITEEQILYPQRFEEEKAA